MVLVEIALGSLVKIVTTIVGNSTSYLLQDFLTRRRIDRAVESACSGVIETLQTFFELEGVEEGLQAIIVDNCSRELEIAVINPAFLFESSLNGQKLFDLVYYDRPLPAEIANTSVDGLYEMVFVRMASIVCSVPLAVKDWQFNAWSENFRRLDDISNEIRALFSKVDALGAADSLSSRSSSYLFKYIAQRISVQVDVTGLRSERPLSGSIDDFFVHPLIVRTGDPGAAKLGEDIALTALSDSRELFSLTSTESKNILYGVPGSGKSTLATWLELQSVNLQTKRIPLKVILSDLDVSHLPSLLEMLKRVAGINAADQIDNEFLQRYIANRGLVIIFDGFDEISAVNRHSVLQWIEDISEFAPGCPVLVTSRPLTTDHLSRMSDKWRRWEIEPFDEDMIVLYMQKWYAKITIVSDIDRVSDFAALAQQWIRDPTIGPLTGNPLLLTTLLTVHHLDGTIPTGRAELYSRYVRGMLGTWDDRRNVKLSDAALSSDEKKELLTDIALTMFDSGHDGLDDDVMEEVVGRSLELMRNATGVAKTLSVLRERSGLIVGPGSYSFTHKSIAEFLVAESAIQGNKKHRNERIDRFLLFSKRDLDQWNTVIFLWAGLATISDLEAFVYQCLESGDTRLALGLFLDQYVRLPFQSRESLARAVVEVLSSLTIVDDDGRYLVGGGRYPSPVHKARFCGSGELNIPSFSLRSIGGGASLEDLLQRLEEDGLFSIDISSGMSLNLKKFIWANFKNSLIRKRGFDYYISIIPYRSLRDRWLYWILERAISIELRPEEYTPPGGAVYQLDDVLRRIPELRPYAGLAAMSIYALDASLEHRREWNKAESLGKSIRIIAENTIPGISDGDLAATIDWGTIMNSKNRDLLEFYELAMVSETAPSSHVNTKKAQDYVSKLIYRRSALP